MTFSQFPVARLGALTLALGWAGLLGSMCPSACADNTAATGRRPARRRRTPTRVAAKGLTRKLPGHSALASRDPLRRKGFASERPEGRARGTHRSSDQL